MLQAHNEGKIYEANFWNQWLYLCYWTKPGSTHLPWSKVNLLTLGCDEGKYSVFCRAQTRSRGSLCSKDPNFLVVFREEFLKAQFEMKAVGCVTFFWLVGGEVTGWCPRTLVLSWKLPSSTWVEALVPVEELKDILLCTSLEEELRLLYCCTVVWLLFLCFCIRSIL